MLSRYIEPQIKEYIDEKIILVTGPRQTGKTTMSKSLYMSYDYINYDHRDHREKIRKKSWDRDKKLIIFDELHKMEGWKKFIKGVFDVEGIPPNILVTGSAKLDTFRKVGDSLAGRFFKYRLYPLDLKELKQIDPKLDLDMSLDRLMQLSGFPEPFIKGTETFYRLWKNTHLDVIVREDLTDLSGIRHISDIETLIQLLRKRVGSPVSYASLSEDLQVSPKTVKHWIQVLENLYVIFKVPPYHKNIARSLLKEPKYYFFDNGMVNKDDGIKFENLVANALLKECHFLEDSLGVEAKLFYLRNRQGNEVDFLVTIDEKPTLMTEVKLSDSNLAKDLVYFSKYFTNITRVQLVKNLPSAKSYPDGIRIEPGAKWLSKLSLH